MKRTTKRVSFRKLARIFAAVVIAVALTAAVMFYVARSQLQKRLDESINTVSHDISLHPRSKLHRDLAQPVLRSLLASNVYTLRTPTIANAWISPQNRLTVTWIGDKPTADSIAIVDYHGGEVARLHIPSFYDQELVRERQVGVLYDVLFDVTHDAGAPQRIKWVDWPNYRVVLSQGDRRISDAVPITAVTENAASTPRNGE